MEEEQSCLPYRLISLKSSDPLNKSENLVTALRLCPELQAVALTSGPSFQESSLWNLARLNQLSDLSLTNGPSAYPLDFYNSVVPVLEAIGHQLNNLILNRFACVDIHGNRSLLTGFTRAARYFIYFLVFIVLVIGKCCPRLKNLALSEICHFAPVDSIQPELYTQLEALELWSLVGVQLPSLVIKQLTTPCRLVQNLLFRNCDALTDQLLNELWLVRPGFSSSRQKVISLFHQAETIFPAWQPIKAKTAVCCLHTNAVSCTRRCLCVSG